jgi:hypothetical protein
MAKNGNGIPKQDLFGHSPELGVSVLAYRRNRQSILGTDGNGLITEQLKDYIREEALNRTVVQVPQRQLVSMATLMRQKIQQNSQRMAEIIQDVRDRRLSRGEKERLLIELAQLEDNNKKISSGLEVIAQNMSD